MADNFSGIKISQLDDPNRINDNDIIPFTNDDMGDKQTRKIKLSALRDQLNYANAFLTVQEGLANTIPGQIFHVYVDDTQLEVYAYLNNNGAAEIVQDAQGNPFKGQTAKALDFIRGELGLTMIGHVSSFARLREIKPPFEGAIVELLGWNEGSTYGGGRFQGKLSTGADDNGIVAAGDGFHWRRINVDEGINPEWFGYVNGSGNDVSTTLKQVIAQAVNLKRPVVFRDGAQMSLAVAGIEIPVGVDLTVANGGRAYFEITHEIETTGQFLVKSKNRISGLVFNYPKQTKDINAKPIVRYGPIFVGAGFYSSFTGINVGNAYYGFKIGGNDEGSASYITMKDINGAPIYRGISLDRVLDIPRISDIHWNYNMYLNSDQDYAQSLKQWIHENGEAFHFGRVDFAEVQRIFAFGYSKGIFLRGERYAGSADSIRFTGCDMDICVNPIYAQNFSGQLVIRNGKFFGTTYGNLVIDKLNLFNMDGYNPNVVLNGILMIASGSRFNFMMATNFNGRAIHFADSYDNVMGDIRVMWSGNQSAFALEVGAWKADSTSSRDESNANTFLAVMAHNCREKSWLIAGSKTNVVRIHDEAILSTTATPSNPIGIESRNGYGYTSCYFSSIGGHLGDVSFATFDKASTVKPVLTIGSSVTCSCDNIASGRDGANVAVISGDPGPSGAGTIASVTCNEFRTLANARTATTALVCNNAILVDPSSPILSGTINGDLTLMSSATWIGLSNLRVGGVTNVGTPAMFSNCTFNGLLNITFDNFGTILNRMRHTFEHCKINDAVKSDTSKVIFRDCSLISTKDFTITGAGEGVRFESSRINMNVIMDNKASLEFIDSEANGTNVATSSTGTILVSNSSWSTGAINATAATQVIIREGSVMQALNGVVNLRVIDSTVASPFTLGNNARVWLSNANMNDVTISGTGINLDADKTFFNRFVFDSGKTNTGAWRISQDCVAWTTANWVVPTVVSGYGVRTYDISTGTIYKVVSGAWKVVTESTA
ncbi:putative exopolysaccharide biosynthesis protein [Serratia phage BUCT660]|nr:putative exopolysaccharide biosynthesis protein [Serratia phage BUCT660]